jgi:hypothetical protein
VGISILADFLFYTLLRVNLTLVNDTIPTSHSQHFKDTLLRIVRTSIKLHVSSKQFRAAHINGMYKRLGAGGEKKAGKSNRDLFYCIDSAVSWKQRGKSRNPE